MSRIFPAIVLLAAFSFVNATSAQAAPPPPPLPGILEPLQGYIRGLTEKSSEAYEGALADDVKVSLDDQLVAQSKGAWMSSISPQFSRGYNQNVTVEHAYLLGRRVMLVERVDRIFGDCCVYHRVEILTFRNGLVAAINRSDEFYGLLRADGHRQDEPRGIASFRNDHDNLSEVLSELHSKWQSSPEILERLDESQSSWERSVTATCATLVRDAFDHGTIEPVKEDECLSQAALQRAALLSSTFRSTLRN